MAIPQNPDISSTQFEPGIFLSISTAPAAASGGGPPQALLIVAPGVLSGAAATGAPYSLTAGTAQPNQIERRYDLGDIATAYNRRSPLANRIRAALQEVPVGIDVFAVSPPEPVASGFTGVASALITVGGTAVGSGVFRGFVGGEAFSFIISNGDTAATVATRLKTAIDQQCLNAPMVTGAIIASVTLPLAYVARGETGNERPVVLLPPSSVTGLTFSPGTITITTDALGNNAGASLFTLTCGTQSLTVAIAVGQTPTQQATSIAAAINASTFPLRATSTAGVVRLYYASGWVVHRITVASTEDANGSVYTLADRHDHAGAIATVATVPGTPTATALQGVGTPTLTTLLANRAKGAFFPEWYSEFSDSTSAGAVYSHVEFYAGGGLGQQQGQRVFYGSSLGVEVAKTIVSAPSPALSNSWRYAAALSQDSVSQSGNLAVALAARVCATPLPFNLDGTALRQGDLAPILGPRSETDLDPPSRDVAMRNYYLTCFSGAGGQVRVVRGVTTWSGGGGNDRAWSDFSFGRLFDDARYRLKNWLSARFTGRVLFDNGVAIRVPNGFTLDDVRAAVIEWLETRDGITINNARFLASLVQVGVDADDPTQVNIAVKLKVPREIHKIAGPLSRAS